jgi:hypothetical protein
MSEIMLVAVPGGIAADTSPPRVVLRVLVTPNLTGGSLAADGMEQWPPASFVGATLTVDFAATIAGQKFPVEVRPPHVGAQPDLWKAFFGSDTIVTPRLRRAEALREVDVDGTSAKAAAIAASFARAAATELRLDRDDRPALDAVVARELIERWSGPEPAAAPLPPLPPPPPFRPPNFHQTIAMLREHPHVLRALGLIFDITLPAASLPVQSGVLRIRWPDAPNTLPAFRSPWTQFSAKFLPATPRNTTLISSGMVALTGGEPGTTASWTVVTVDVDNGAARLRDAARAAASVSPRAAPATGVRPFLLPALRSNGMAIVRNGRQTDFGSRRRSADNFARTDISEAVLDADDLVLGYRVDIKPQGRDWMSLHERAAKYKVTRNGVETAIGPSEVREEGHIKSHAAVDHGAGKLHADEIVARWSGWSLSVERPGLTAPSDRATRGPNPKMPYQFGFHFTVPAKTLPRLRFSNGYRIRARVADVAGGGLGVGDPAADRCFTEQIRYRRFDPVEPPEIALAAGVEAKSLGPGESVEHVVLRSGGPQDAAAAQAHLRRVLRAPRTSLTLAEQHGALDAMTPAQIADMARRVMTDTMRSEPLFAEEVLFPDFAADGVCVFPGLRPGDPAVPHIERAFLELWPDPKPKEIVLMERAAGDANVIEFQPASLIGDPQLGDRLLVKLAKAEELTLELSSFLKEDMLDHFAISGQSLPAASVESASRGRHPMVTPARAVTFTHAVRRPLGEAAGAFTPQRGGGATSAVLDPNPLMLGIDSLSTGRVDITASWKEPDDGGGHDVVDAPVQTLAVERGDTALRGPIRHEFGDTRHRMVKYAVTAISRYRHFFAADDPGPFAVRKELPAAVSIPSASRPPPPVVLSTMPAFAWEETREGNPAHLVVRRRRPPNHFRLELETPWHRSGEGELLGVIVATDRRPTEGEMPFLTQSGLDPVRATVLPDRWPVSSELTGNSLPPRFVFLAEAQHVVMVVPHQPWFDGTRCFVDVAISPVGARSYCPFVQLAVARYQPASLPNIELSQLVKTEMVQMLPERRLTVRRAEDDLFVKLEGLDMLGPVDDQNRWIARLERFEGPPGTLAESVQLTALNATTDGIPAWVQMTNQIRFGRLGQEVQLQIVKGNVGPFRVRVQEFESLPGHSHMAFEFGDDLTARTVYSDVVVL